MTAYRVFLKIISFVVLFKGTRGDVSYVMGFCHHVGSCPNFNNDIVDVNLTLTKSDDGETDGMALAGKIECLKEFGSGYKFSIDIAKETDVGSEPMWSFTTELCKAIEEEDAPWTPVFKALNIETCPIAKAEYPVEEMMLDSSQTKDYLSSEFCGEYELMCKVQDDQMNDVACFTMSVSIKEEETE